MAAIKTLAEAVSGESLGLQEMAFYLGGAAFTVYTSLLAGAFAGGLANAGAEHLLGSPAGGGDRDALMLGVGGVAALVMLWLIVSAGAMFDYDGTDGFGRGAMAVIGLAAVGGGIYVWRSTKPKETPTASE